MERSPVRSCGIRSAFHKPIARKARNVTRLFVAALIGCLIGLNRFAHHRYIGVRTLGLVALGAAALVVAALETGTGSDQIAAASRIIQVIVTDRFEGPEIRALYEGKRFPLSRGK